MNALSASRPSSGTVMEPRTGSVEVSVTGGNSTVADPADVAVSRDSIRLAFVTALGEFVASILLYTHRTRPISIAVAIPVVVSGARIAIVIVEWVPTDLITQ
mgnify:CR=1 FL=1